MRHLIHRPAFVALAFLLTSASMATIGVPAIEAQSRPVVEVTFELDAVTGFVYVDEAERVVVVGDDEVLIFGLDGSLLHRVTGVAEARGAEEWGRSVVVIAGATDELVVIDTTSGQVTRRIQAGVEVVSSVAVAGDTAWFAHGPFSWLSGIGRVDLSSGVSEPGRLGENKLYTGSIIEVSPALPSSVFAYQSDISPSGLYRYDDADRSLHWSLRHDHVPAFVASNAGDRLWAYNGRLVELSTATLAETGVVYDFGPATDMTAEQLAVRDDLWMVAAAGRELSLFRVGQPEPLTSFELRGPIKAVDVTAEQLFLVEGRRYTYQAPGRENTLRITPHDFVPERATIGVAIDAHGTPTAARPSLAYQCSDGSTGTIPRVPYGFWTDLEVPAAATWCSVTLSHVADRHRTYFWTSDGRLIEGVTTRVEVTGDVNEDSAEFLQVLPSPMNDATEFVRQQYHDLLQRYPEPAGVKYWVSLLNTGAMTDYQLVQKFVESPEFLGSMAPAMRLYLAYFLRWPDESGLAFWANAIRNGTSVGQISDFFAASPEFMQRYGTLSNKDFVTLVYANVLGRSPDSAGYNYWLAQMNAGMTRGAVMTRFSESPEYVAADWGADHGTCAVSGSPPTTARRGRLQLLVPAIPPDAIVGPADRWLPRQR